MVEQSTRRSVGANGRPLQRPRRNLECAQMHPFQDRESRRARRHLVVDLCIAELRCGFDIKHGRIALHDATSVDDVSDAACEVHPEQVRPDIADGQSIDQPSASYRDTDFNRQLIELLPRLERFARRFTHSSDEAKDVVQGACERALRSAGQFEPGTRLDSWMYRIVQTIAIDRARTARDRRAAAEVIDTIHLASDGRIHERLEASLDLARLQPAIAKLPREQRRVLALVVTEEMTYQQVADYIGAPIGTVMSRLSRARQRLKAVLPRA